MQCVNMTTIRQISTTVIKKNYQHFESINFIHLYRHVFFSSTGLGFGAVAALNIIIIVIVKEPHLPHVKSDDAH